MDALLKPAVQAGNRCWEGRLGFPVDRKGSGGGVRSFPSPIPFLLCVYTSKLPSAPQPPSYTHIFVRKRCCTARVLHCASAFKKKKNTSPKMHVYHAYTSFINKRAHIHVRNRHAQNFRTL